MKVAYINPFLKAAQDICCQTIKVAVTAGKPRLLESDERLWKLYQISALIQLDNGVRGVAAVSFSERVALALASGLAGDKFLSINADCKDALGEVANLIVGSAKRQLPTDLVKMSTPKIVDTHALDIVPNPPTILVPFDAAIGRFAVHITLEIPAGKTVSPPAAVTPVSDKKAA